MPAGFPVFPERDRQGRDQKHREQDMRIIGGTYRSRVLAEFPGEEVHSPGNPVHIIHFGGGYSINEKAASDEERYRRETEEILRSIPPEELPQGLDPFPVAASEWVFREIR